MWVNPDFYDTYLVVPDPGIAPTAETQVPAKEETPSLSNRIDDLLLEKTISKNCAICSRCMTKEQRGTLWCYACGEPMLMQRSLPLSHSQIASLKQEKSRDPPQKQDLRTTETAARKTEQEETHRSHGSRQQRDTSGITFGGLTWAQRMGAWRKAAFKKKDEHTWVSLDQLANMRTVAL